MYVICTVYSTYWYKRMNYTVQVGAATQLLLTAVLHYVLQQTKRINTDFRVTSHIHNTRNMYHVLYS